MNMKRTVLCLVSLALLGVLWVGYYQHRPALVSPPDGLSPLETRAQALLASADKVRVEVETLECLQVEGSSTVRCHLKEALVTNMPRAEIVPIVRHLTLTPVDPSSKLGSYSGWEPSVNLVFYKGGKEQAFISVSYGAFSNDYFSDSEHSFCGSLDAKTVQRVRQLVAQHPELLQALRKAGVSRRDLDPNHPPRPEDE